MYLYTVLEISISVFYAPHCLCYYGIQLRSCHSYVHKFDCRIYLYTVLCCIEMSIPVFYAPHCVWYSCIQLRSCPSFRPWWQSYLRSAVEWRWRSLKWWATALDYQWVVIIKFLIKSWPAADSCTVAVTMVASGKGSFVERACACSIHACTADFHDP